MTSNKVIVIKKDKKQMIKTKARLSVMPAIKKATMSASTHTKSQKPSFSLSNSCVNYKD